MCKTLPPTSPGLKQLKPKLQLLTRVKGCKWLYKFHTCTPALDPPVSHPHSLGRVGAAPHHTSQMVQSHFPPRTMTRAQSDNDILSKGSGLMLAFPKRHTQRNRSHNCREPPQVAHSSRASSRFRETKRAGYQQKTLNAFSFLPLLPRKETEIQFSNREVEVELNEYSRTFVSTVP
jgi:hypothetical protein